MKTTGLIASTLLVSALFFSCTKDKTQVIDPVDDDLVDAMSSVSPTGNLSYYILPSSGDYGSIPQESSNPITPEKVALGQLLFHETGLAQDAFKSQGLDTYSCATCHHAQGGFQAGRRQGIGEGGLGFGISGEGRTVDPSYPMDSIDVQHLRTPATMNVAYQSVMLWSGSFGSSGPNASTQSQWTVGSPMELNFLGYGGVETQTMAALTTHRQVVDSSLIDQLGYKAMFDAAFPGFPDSMRYSKITAGLAIGAYLRTVLPNEAPFQKWLKGDEGAMSDDEKKGATLFFGKARCYLCHTGPALSNDSFHKMGFGDLDGAGVVVQSVPQLIDQSLGRGLFTQEVEDMFCFKVPQLYNLTDSPFFGHGATFTSVEDVIRYKNEAVPQRAGMPAGTLDPLFIPLGLTETEIQELTAFLEHGLRDPNLIRYVPDSVLSGQCFPNNDTQSQLDLGCQ